LERDLEGRRQQIVKPARRRRPSRDRRRSAAASATVQTDGVKQYRNNTITGRFGAIADTLDGEAPTLH
jgi:hypothetical protein